VAAEGNGRGATGSGTFATNDVVVVGAGSAGLRAVVGCSQCSQFSPSPPRDRVRSGMREFESSHSSQAVTQLKIGRR
jgi:hypothetical protein